MTTFSDQRLTDLRDWVVQSLDDSECTLRTASADASFRRYFRVHTSGSRTCIAMDAPPDKEDCRPFIRVASAFRDAGLNVPDIIAQDLEHGFLLITDLGDRLYLDALNDSTVGSLYEDALAALVRLQGAPTDGFTWLPPYDDTLLRREMELFREWYLGRHLGLSLTSSRQAVIDGVFEGLVNAALEQPRVVVHRDYHSRNLLVTDANNPGILDFQDAVYGPVTYDLVSLLRDCYISWPRERVEFWVETYRGDAANAGIGVGDSAAQFLQWFDLMGVQRHLKAIGIFARLNHRDAKPKYLQDIPRTMGYIREVSARYPVLSEFSSLLDEVGVPRL